MIEPQVDIKLYYKLGIAHIKLYWFLWGTNFFDNLVHLTPDLAPEHEKRLFRLQSLEDFMDLVIEVESEVANIPGSTAHHWLPDVQLSLRNIAYDLEDIDYSFDYPSDFSSVYSHPMNFDALIDKVSSIYFTHQVEFKKAEDRLSVLTKSQSPPDWAAVIAELEAEKVDGEGAVLRIPAHELLKVGWRLRDDALWIQVWLSSGGRFSVPFEKDAKGKLTLQGSLILLLLQERKRPLSEIVPFLYGERKKNSKISPAKFARRVKGHVEAVNNKLRAELLKYQKVGGKNVDPKRTCVTLNVSHVIDLESVQEDIDLNNSIPLPDNI